jgi:hypothetical protein
MLPFLHSWALNCGIVRRDACICPPVRFRHIGRLAGYIAHADSCGNRVRGKECRKKEITLVHKVKYNEMASLLMG